MDIEEEPLLPLVRNRKTKPVQNVKIKRAGHFEDLKKNNEESVPEETKEARSLLCHHI